MRPRNKPGLPANDSSRRHFIRQLGTASLLLTTGNLSSPPSAGYQTLRPAPRRYSSNDKINIACVGRGIMGFNDVHTAVQVPGVTLVAACDLYTGRLQHAKERYGKDLFTTADYREILDRKDIDAVIVATSDHWHARIATEALAKGKAVYGEKPIVHVVEEGLPLIEAQKRSGKPMLSAEHPAFQVALRVNFVSGQGDTSFTRFIGSEGVMEMTGDGFTIRHHKMSEAPGYHPTADHLQAPR